MRRTAFAALAALAVMCLASPARATVIGPGGSVTPTPIDETLAGTVIANTGAVPFAFANDTGTVREVVIRQADNTLAFAYQVNLTGVIGSGDIGRVSGGSFAGWTTNVAQSATGLALVPGTGFTLGTEASISATRSGGVGDTVSFNFNSGVFLAPMTSFVVYVRTNAKSYRAGTIGVIDSGGQTVNGFAPGPEPSSMVLAGLGAIGLVGYGIRRRKARTA
jgi:hypothetical protein